MCYLLDYKSSQWACNLVWKITTQFLRLLVQGRFSLSEVPGEKKCYSQYYSSEVQRQLAAGVEAHDVAAD